jgi:site-specific DNA-adenine methylase
LHLLEDYRGLRLEKDKIEELLKQTLDGFKEAEERWTTEEAGYRAEIRRLELIIARGKQGMTELTRTREHSVIKRKRTHHKSPSDEKLETAYEFLSRDQIYQDAMRQGQRGIKRFKYCCTYRLQNGAHVFY